MRFSEVGLGSSPMSSARKRKRQVLTCLFLFLVKYNGIRTHEWVRVSHPHFAQGFACAFQITPCFFSLYATVHIWGDYIKNMHNDVHIFRKNTFNMHICSAKTEKTVERVVSLSLNSLENTYFEDFFKIYVEYYAYFWTFS